MDISRRLIGASAVWSDDKKLIDVDVSGLIRRLLLFDRYVLMSSRLREFPFLVEYFGYEGLQELLAARLIETRCECLQFGQTAQLSFTGQPTFPLCAFSPSSMECRMCISRGSVGCCGYRCRVSATGQRKAPGRRRRSVRHCLRCLTLVTSDTQTESSETGAPT